MEPQCISKMQLCYNILQCTMYVLVLCDAMQKMEQEQLFLGYGPIQNMKCLQHVCQSKASICEWALSYF